MLCCVLGSTSLRAINHNSSSFVFHERGTSSVLSITSHHKFVFSRKARPSVLSFTSVHKLLHERGTSSVLSFTTHHSVLFTKHVSSSKSIIHICSSCWFHERGTSSVLSFASHHKFFHEKHVPPCYQSHLIIIVFSRKGTSLRAINHNSS
jgi:hypothetical protein